MSLAQAEALTKIRAVHLLALEEERFSALPPRPYAKGFVRTYALVLGLDARPLLASFESHLPPSPPAPLSEAVEIPLEPPAPPSRLRRTVTLTLWILVPAVIALAAILYVNVRDFARSQPTEGLTVPSEEPSSSPAAVALSTPDPAPPPLLPASPLPPVAEATAAPQAGGITLVVTVNEESWLRVLTDGERIFQGIMYPGDTGRWTAQRELEIRIGNAGGVALTVNGRDLGIPGRPREVVTLRFPDAPEEP